MAKVLASKEELDRLREEYRTKKNTGDDQLEGLLEGELTDEEIDKMVEQELGIELTDEEKMMGSIPSNNAGPIVTPDIMKDKGDMSPVMMNHIYDTRTGISCPTDEFVEDDKPLVDVDALLKQFMEGDSLSVDGVREALNKSYKISDNVQISAEDMIALSKLVNDHLNKKTVGEGKGYYNSLPLSIKNLIFKKVGDPIKAIGRSKVEEMSIALIDEIAAEYVQNDSTADLDKMIAEITKSGEELNEGIGKLQGNFHVTIVTRSIQTLKDNKKKAEDIGDLEAASKWQSVIDGMESSINLTDFKEFCKRVKIKNYDIERPDKVFMGFLRKYFDHKKNIYDIRNCPEQLSNHIHDHITDFGNMKVCLAFCKYCMNMNPDNALEHTFMYYFIKNIIAINLIAPKGKLDEDADEDAKNFYKTFLFNLRGCIENIR